MQIIGLLAGGKSKGDFIYKIEIVLEEADESLYWLEVSREADLTKGRLLDDLIIEANELVSIFNAADITAKKNRRDANPANSKSQNH